jgi:hypothetical protein
MKEQLKTLKRMKAPDALIESFIEVCEINASLPEERRAGFSELLSEQCREFGFHDILPDGYFFRPSTLGQSFMKEDCATSGKQHESAAIEQAYRRGYTQGFAECRILVSKGSGLQKIQAEETKFDKWRRRSIQKFASQPGDPEKLPRNVFGGRSTVSPKIRWDIFKRDEFKCVKCGRSASDGTTLEVDHIVSVAKGGFDAVDNLQTLCFECNRGKSHT